MSKQYKIHFEKWKDPYGENIDDVEFPGYIETEYRDDGDIIDRIPKKPMPFIATSLGMVPLTEYTNPSKIYNFWVGHTNFNIGKAVYDIIEETDGVEVLTIFSRYRFRIGIGHQFSDSFVLRDIKKRLLKHLKDKIQYEKRL